MSRRVWAIGWIWGTVGGGLVRAQTPTEPSPGGFLPPPETPAPAQSLDLTQAAINVFVALLVVLIVVALVAYLLKRFSYRLRQTGGGEIRILSQIPIGPSQHLTVVEIAGEVLVLGVTEHSVTALAEIQDAQAIERLRAGSGAEWSALPGGRLPSFREWLRRAQHGPVSKS